VNYREHEPVHEYLIKEFGAEPFDAIIDAYGSQPLFLHCAKYLKPGKTFVSIGVQPPAGSKPTFWSLLGAVGHLISNFFWPAWLGGVNRPYFGAKGFPTLKTLECGADLVRAGKLRVPLDSSWEMEDALKVCLEVWIQDEEIHKHC
jgi:threonine dehydrogenase-like Zn-dependent dehydrogenase